MSEPVAAADTATASPAMLKGPFPPEKDWYAIRPNAQAFDEIRIKTVPRYKESYLSGDEWRIHAEITFYRNGVEVHSVGYRNIETACGRLYAAHGDAIDDGKAFFGGNGDHCDQEGCAERATVKLRKIADYGRDGHKSEPHRPTFRCFCPRHTQRGDCGLDDANSNYMQVAERMKDGAWQPIEEKPHG